MDSFLVTLVIITIVALSNWLQRRAQSQQQQTPPDRGPQPRPPAPHGPRNTPAPPSSPQPTLESTLERELRRLLGEEPELPPVLDRPRPVPSSPPVPPPTVVPVPTHAPSPVRPTPRVAPSPVLTPVPATPAPTRFTESASGMARAQQIHESVAQRLRNIDHQTETHLLIPVRLSSVPPEASVVYQLRRNPLAARQAFIASLVLGPPKGLEE